MRDEELAVELSLGEHSTIPVHEHQAQTLAAGVTDDVDTYRKLQETMKKPAALETPPASLLASINDEIDQLENDNTVTELTLAPAIPLPTKRTNGSAQSRRIQNLSQPAATNNKPARGSRWLAAAAIAAVCGAGVGFAGGYGAGSQNTASPAPANTPSASAPSSPAPSSPAPSSAPAEPVKNVVAEAQLATLKDKSPRGSAQLVRSANGVSVVVSATDLTPSSTATNSGYLEVWLINSDLKRMVSIGILTKATAASFSVPQKLIDEGYVIVDISQEEFDDKPQHSGKTLARGGLNV